MVWTKALIRLLIILLLQLLILNQLQVFGVCHPMVYVMCLIMMPTRLNPKWDMLIGAAIGLLVDLFSNSPGIHMAACVLVMYLRREILRRLVTEPERIKGEITLAILGTESFIQYSLLLVLLHHSLVFILNAWSWGMIGWTLLEILVSSTISFLLILLYNKAIDKGDRRD